MEIRKNIANFVTSIRIFGAVAIIFLKPLELTFFIVYSFCGLSDAVDGFIARKLHITSELGTKLDSIADLSFYTVMMIRILPELCKQLWPLNWVLLFTVLFIRVCSYAVSAIKFHKFSSLHTVLNKISGGAVFLIPYMIMFSSIFNYYGFLTCTITFLASVQELLFYVKKKKADA